MLCTSISDGIFYKEHLILTLGQNDLGGEDGLERKVSLNTSQHHIQNHNYRHHLIDSSIHRLILALTIDEIQSNIYHLDLLYTYHLPDKLRWFHCQLFIVLVLIHIVEILFHIKLEHSCGP